MLTWLALIIGGTMIASRAEGRIKRGIRDRIWQEEELASLQTWIDSPRTKIIAFLPILALAGFLIVDHRTTLLFGMLPLCLHTTSTLSRWSVLLNPYQQGLTQDWHLDWHTWKPLRSGHWGEGCVPGENSSH